MTTPTAPGSTGYGVDIYGTVLYGYSQPKSLSVEPFLATQTDYGRLTLTWQSPNDTTWDRLRLVRSTAGFVSTPDDGIILLDIRSNNIRTTYDDIDLPQGFIYYYTIFMAQDAATWDSGTTYIQSAVVFYNGSYWYSLQASNTNHTPSIGSAYWTPTTFFPTWLPAGSAAALAVKDQGYTAHLYERTPQPYKIVKSDLFANTIIDNPQLYRFLSLFGFAFSELKTQYDNVLVLNDPDLVSDIDLDLLGQELGIKTDYISSPRLRRQRVKNASVNYRMKGSIQGLHNAIADVTGWDSDITVGPNMMLSNDQAEFAHPSYDTWRSDTNYFVNQFVSYNGFNYKNLVASFGSAQAPTGTNSSNTWWQVQVGSTDGNTLLNPGTKGINTWGIDIAQGTTVITERAGVGSPVAGGSLSNALQLTITAGSPVTGDAGVISVMPLVTPTWSSSTNFYFRGNYVLYSGNYYVCLKRNGSLDLTGAVTPGTDDRYWKLQAPNVGLGGSQVERDGIPIPVYPSWDSVIDFSKGTIVQYQGVLYVALVDSVNKPPTGRYASNTYWQYVKPAERAYTISSYSQRAAGAGVKVHEEVLFYDKDGNVIAGLGPQTLLPTFSNFDTDYQILNGTNDNSTSSTWTEVNSVAVPNPLWESTFGQARVNPDRFDALATKPKYSYIYLSYANSTASVGYTFGVDVLDTTNYENGVIFRRTGTTSFWFASRTRLVLVNAGTETVKATWPRLNDGDRIDIQLAGGSNIIVNVNLRDGTGNRNTLASITDSTFLTGTNFGILQRYALGA